MLRGAPAARPSRRATTSRSSRATRSTPEQAKAYGEVLHRTLTALKTCRHPTLAQIEGICVGGGLEIAALCDLRICGESSRFGVPISRLGLVMAYPEIDGLKRLVGRAATLEILLEGRVFGAAEAKDKGLVNRVVPDAEVAAEARATAERIAAGAPLVARWHKKFLRPAGGPGASERIRARRGLRLLRHRGLRDRLPLLPGQDQAGLQGAVTVGTPGSASR